MKKIIILSTEPDRREDEGSPLDVIADYTNFR